MRGVSFRPVNYFLFEKRNEKKKESKGFDRVYFQTNSITFGKERDREKIDVVNFKVSLLRSGKRRGCEIDRLSDQSMGADLSVRIRGMRVNPSRSWPIDPRDRAVTRGSGENDQSNGIGALSGLN